MTPHHPVEQWLSAPCVPSYSASHRALEIGAILGVAVLAAEAALRVARGVEDAMPACVVAAGMLTGYVAADVVTGLFHWAADTYGSEQTPLLGANFIRPFREHHVDLEDITRHDVIETCGNSCVIGSVVLGAGLLWIPDPRGGAGALFALTAVLVMVVAAVVTNLFHKWAHMASPPAAARALQRLGVILAREHHAVHHVAPFRTYYCITTGWMNRPFRQAHVHEALEWVLARFGLRPSAGA